MSAPFFQSEAIKRLHRRAQAWQGTPFRERHCLPQVGVDCVPFVWDLMHASRVCGPVDLAAIPPYKTDWSAHNDQSILLPILDDWLEREEIATQKIEDRDALQAGDVLIFSPGKCAHHLGVALSATHFIHVYRGPGVVRDPLDHKRFSRYFQSALRPLAQADNATSGAG